MKFTLAFPIWTLLYVIAAHAQSLVAVPEQSSVTYHLVHPLHKIEATSKEVHYKVDADVQSRQIKHIQAHVDVMTFDSGNSNRDSHAMEVIDAITYPDVNFNSTAITQSGDSIRVDGVLDFHGVKKEVSITGTTSWEGNRLTLRGGFDVSLAAFQIERPSLLMIPVEDTLQFAIVAVFDWH